MGAPMGNKNAAGKRGWYGKSGAKKLLVKTMGKAKAMRRSYEVANHPSASKQRAHFKKYGRYL